jgi:hypothetical protein
MTKPRAFITSVDLRPSDGPHEYVTIYIRGQNVGTLCVGKGDGDALALLLMPGMKPEERSFEAPESIDDLIARSSLGDPDAVRLRATVAPETVERVLARAAELESEQTFYAPPRHAMTEKGPRTMEELMAIQKRISRALTATAKQDAERFEERAGLAVATMARVIGIDPAGADHRVSEPLYFDDDEAWRNAGCPANARVGAKP